MNLESPLKSFQRDKKQINKYIYIHVCVYKYKINYNLHDIFKNYNKKNKNSFISSSALSGKSLQVWWLTLPVKLTAPQTVQIVGQALFWVFLWECFWVRLNLNWLSEGGLGSSNLVKAWEGTDDCPPGRRQSSCLTEGFPSVKCMSPKPAYAWMGS